MSAIRLASGVTFLATFVLVGVVAVLHLQNVGGPWLRGAVLFAGILGIGALRTRLRAAERREELLGPPQNRSVLAELHPDRWFSDPKDHARFLRALAKAIAAGRVEEIPVIRVPTEHGQKWYREVGTDTVYRYVEALLRHCPDETIEPPPPPVWDHGEWSRVENPVESRQGR